MAGNLTVRNLLGFDALRDYRLVAGRRGLSNGVASATVMELVDGADWLKPGTIVLTVGSNFGENPESFTNWLKSLAAVGVTAVFLKLGRFIDTVPGSSLAAADSLGLPLVIMPDDTRPDELLAAIHEFIYTNRNRPSISSLLFDLVNPYAEQDMPHLAYLAQSLGVDLSVPYYLVLADSLDPDASIESLGQSVLFCARRLDKKAVFADISGRALLIFHPKPNCSHDARTDLGELTAKMQELAKAAKATMWISSCTSGIECFKKAYDPLALSIDFCRKTNVLSPMNDDQKYLEGEAVFYDELGYIQWLSVMTADRELCERFIRANLTGGLSAFSAAKQRELIETLRVYLLHGGSLKAMSDSIHIHKNTLLYRINSIEKTLGCDVNAVNTRINLYTSILLKSYLEASPAPERS